MHDRLSLYLSREEIADGVGKLATQIQEDYRDKRPLLVGVLKGSFVFLAGLARELGLPLSIDFVTTRSYPGSGRQVKWLSPSRSGPM